MLLEIICCGLLMLAGFCQQNRVAEITTPEYYSRVEYRPQPSTVSISVSYNVEGGV